MKDKPVILVVDDQIQNNELLEAHLVPQGYEIVSAVSGEEALDKLVHNQVDLILLDILMPKMSGLEVLEKLRANEKTRFIPVVMVTALKDTQDKVKAFEAGCDDFISKPFDKVELLARIKSLLKIKSLHDEVDVARDYSESIINTERKQQEENKYKAIIHASMDGFWLADLQGNILEVNDAYCKMLGYNREELLKMKISDLEVNEKPGDIQAHIRKIKENGSDCFETRHKCKEGSIIDIVISVSYLKSIDQMFVFVRDITERKQAEKIAQKRLYELEVFYKAAVGREERIVELKKEVENWKNKLEK